MKSDIIIPIKIWSRVKGDITTEMIKEYDEQNDIFYQIDSGARGNWGQVTQIAGMKGLVASPSGKTIGTSNSFES